MSQTLQIAVAAITAALVLYTIGVWSEHRRKNLTAVHLAFFWAGLVCDTTGTTLMSEISRGFLKSGGWQVHKITGILAIALMLLHALWATVVLIKKDETAKAAFHKFSLMVWTIWLVPFLLGMLMGMSR